MAKNLLVGDSITYERKIREMIVANRIEQTISKQQILEIYLNSIYLGRSSWGVDLAARAYFGKPVKDVTLTEGAFLAGLTKGPAYFNPDRHRDRAQGRLDYVLSRMQEDGAITADAGHRTPSALRLNFAARAVRRDTGFHLVDEIGREARALASVPSLTAQSYEVRSTIRPDLQRATEAALQEGLAQYEQSAGRVEFRGPEANLSDAIRKLEADPKTDRSKPTWVTALEQVRLPLYDVHWTPAVVVEKRSIQGTESIRVGLKDGRILPLSTYGGRTRAGSTSTTSFTCQSLERRVTGAIPAKQQQQQQRHPRRACGCGRRCRAPPWCWRTKPDRPRAGDGRRLLLSAEPAQPRDPGAAAARLLVQADDLSRRAEQRACSPTRWWTTRRSPTRRSAAPTATPATPTTGRRTITTAAMPAP